ncbi:hypothetical protein NH44784_052971 [Achromobacter xylosoxidans NH44784-1996]|nr:hypothetical protein NH44784_052971 [Achromobacter xylosoxidans NH44784-1996]
MAGGGGEASGHERSPAEEESADTAHGMCPVAGTTRGSRYWMQVEEIVFFF